MSRAALLVDRTSPVPLYFQVAQHLEQLIESGDLATGTRLENEVDLAEQFGLSRPTMRRAIGYLVDRGLLVRKRGVGTQVVHAKARRQVELTSYEYRVLEYLLTHAGKVISKSELTEHLYSDDAERDSNVIEVFIRRLRSKLDPEAKLNPIATLRGAGYRWDLPRS